MEDATRDELIRDWNDLHGSEQLRARVPRQTSKQYDKMRDNLHGFYGDDGFAEVEHNKRPAFLVIAVTVPYIPDTRDGLQHPESEGCIVNRCAASVILAPAGDGA